MDDSNPPDEQQIRQQGIPVHEVDLQQALEMARDLQRRQQFEQAEQIYLTVLSHLPAEPNALHFLGVLRHQQGRNDEALQLISLAIEGLPGVAGPWLNLANVLLEAGYYDDAEKALQQVIALSPDSVLAYNNLGILHLRQQAWEAAEDCFRRALALDASRDYLHHNLANLCFQTGRLRESTEHGLRSIGLQPGNSAARELLSRSLFLIGDRSRAIQSLRDWAIDEPANPRPVHYLAAAGASAAPPRASDAYVEQVFDNFADSFDVKLEGLGYRAPQLVCDALSALGERLPRDASILDAGCGTGLCGQLLRPLGRRLEGVDLSSGMLARARARGGYDALHQAELGAFLERHPQHYDIIASADTLVYFGALEQVVGAAARALRPGGALAASVEALDDDSVDHRLGISGRYAHSAAYLRRVLAASGLQLVALQPQVLRYEMKEPVRGWIFSALGAGCCAASRARRR